MGAFQRRRLRYALVLPRASRGVLKQNAGPPDRSSGARRDRLFEQLGLVPISAIIGGYPPRAICCGAESLGIMMPRAFEKKNPGVAVKILRAHLRGIRYFQKNRDEYARWVAEREGIDADVVRAVVFDKEAIDAEHPVTDRAGALILIRASRDAGFIPKSLVPTDEALKEWMDKYIDESHLGLRQTSS